MAEKSRVKKRGADSASRIYTLIVNLVSGLPREPVGQAVTQVVQIRGDQTLEELHQAIFDAYDRTEQHLYEFIMGSGTYDREGQCYMPPIALGELSSAERPIGDVTGTSLDDLGLTVGRTFWYRFDFGESWRYEIQVVDVEEGVDASNYPRVIDGEVPVLRRAFEDETISSMEEFWEFLIKSAIMMDRFMDRTRVEFRKSVEAKPLLANTRLRPALNKLPAIWVEGIANALALTCPGRNRERVDAIVRYLSDPQSLPIVWASLPLPCRDMLSWLLIDQGGWATIQKLSANFGRDEDNTWWWSEDEIPTTPLGLLRFHGVVFVGTRKTGKRNVRIASVPVELRDGLRECAEAPDAFEDAPAMPEVQDDEIFEEFGPVPEDAFEPEEVRMGLREFLCEYPFEPETRDLYDQILDQLEPEEMDPEVRGDVREFLIRVIEGGRAKSRLQAYKIGLLQFGRDFVRPALNDPTKTVRQWALKVFGPEQAELFDR
jgi:hypothetical protein